MKKISILIPCYNEEENIVAMSKAVTDIFHDELCDFDYEIIFIDNDSNDNSRFLLRQICSENKKIKAILNAKNFGQFNSPYYGNLQATGDCVVDISCDFQDPVEMIPVMVHEWEKGYKIIAMQKTSSEENRLMYFFRSNYYKLVKKYSSIDLIEQFTGYGLYDRDFIEVLRKLNDPIPFIRGIVAELGYKIKVIPFKQKKRRAGKTHNNFYILYDAAMLSITSYTKIGLRMATFIGLLTSIASIVVAIVYFVYKLTHWQNFSLGMAPMVIGLFFIGAVILFFLGIMGEYILNINQRVMNRPLVIEEERINFDKTSR